MHCRIRRRPGSSRRAFQPKPISCPQSGCGSFYLGDLEPHHGRLNRTERTMRKTRNALLGILTMMSGAILAVPTEAAERYAPGVYVYKAGPERWFSYPYGGSYQRRGNLPYVNHTGVTTPPRTTATTGITALLTIGNTAAGSRQQGLRSRPLPRLAQNEERQRTGSEARGRRELGRGALAMSVAPESGRNRIMIYGPK